MDGGSSCSGIAFAKHYNRCSIDKTLALSSVHSFPILLDVTGDCFGLLVLCR